MKIFILCSLFLVSLSMSSCNTEKKSDSQPSNTEAPASATPQVQTSPDLTPIVDPSTAPPPAPSPAQNANGVWHYTCPKGCPGGAANQGNCAKCGGPLAHNQAYHQ